MLLKSAKFVKFPVGGFQRLLVQSLAEYSPQLIIQYRVPPLTGVLWPLLPKRTSLPYHRGKSVPQLIVLQQYLNFSIVTLEVFPFAQDDYPHDLRHIAVA